MSELEQIVIVGASAAGLAAAETLRREGFQRRIVLIGEELQYPYDRPPLSKQILKGVWGSEKIELRDAAQYRALDLDLRFGAKATGLDLKRAAVQLANADDVSFDALILATGVVPRKLATDPALDGVMTLRTLNDAVLLRDRIQNATNVAIIGAGFLGTEVAAAAIAPGRNVNLIEATRAPLANCFGETIGYALADLHRSHGVRLHARVGEIRLFGDNGRVHEIRLSGGTILKADLVIVAIGSLPATDWLAGSGLKLDNGIVCDEYCCAHDGVFGAGDVASWMHLGFQRRMRVEHRLNATEQGENAALNLLGRRQPFLSCPFFWSDQYDLKMQAYGIFPRHADIVVESGSIESGTFVAVYRENGRIVGALGWNSMKTLRAWKVEIERTMSANRLNLVTDQARLEAV